PYLLLEADRPPIDLRRVIAPPLGGVEDLTVVEGHHALNNRGALDDAGLRDDDFHRAGTGERDRSLEPVWHLLPNRHWRRHAAIRRVEHAVVVNRRWRGRGGRRFRDGGCWRRGRRGGG